MDHSCPSCLRLGPWWVPLPIHVIQKPLMGSIISVLLVIVYSLLVGQQKKKEKRGPRAGPFGPILYPSNFTTWVRLSYVIKGSGSPCSAGPHSTEGNIKVKNSGPCQNIVGRVLVGH